MTNDARDAGRTKRYTINDVADEDSPHVFIRNFSAKQTGTFTHILMPYTSQQTGEQKSIEIPHTWIPYDLSEWIPKEELVRNPELRALYNSGTIEFVSTREALAKLEEPEAQAEQSRIIMERRARHSPVTKDEDRPTLGNQSQNSGLEKPNPGQIDTETAGVNNSVVQVMNDPSLGPDRQLVMLRNMMDIMSDEDKRYVRGHTEDPQIRRLVG